MASRKKSPAGRGEPESFEAVYKRLEETVAKLEAGGLTLDESLTLYEEGMKLAQRSQELLQQAELKITKLQEDFAPPQADEEAAPYEAGEEEELPLE